MLAIVVVGFAPQLSPAGLYSPDEPTPFPVRPDGTAAALPFGTRFDGPFPQLLQPLLNAADANPARTSNPDREKVLARIAARRMTPPGRLTAAELAGLTADLVRVGRPDEALNLLAPRSRDRSPDFRALANLAHVHAVRGEWDEAARWHELAAFEVDLPDDLAPPAQRTWLRTVERKHTMQWLKVHRQRAAARPPAEAEEVFPLFPVRFVSEAGGYEPGALAAAERAKLPPDAVAVVQQLFLWSPWDAGLYWLLAELYAADGKLREAAVIFDQCADGRQYSNRRVFMAHRTAVRAAVEKLPPEKSADELVVADPPPAPSPSPADDAFLPDRRQVALVGTVFGLLAAALLALQVRAVRRRREGQCGPGGCG